jgi:hypothetical protein
MAIYVGIVLLFSVRLDASTSLEDKTREALMGVLMMKCRTTGRDFSTGIYADAETSTDFPIPSPRRRVRTAIGCTAGGPERRGCLKLMISLI